MRNYVITAVVCLAIGFAGGGMLSRHDRQAVPLASVDSQVASHDVELTVPVKAKDKRALRDLGAIDKRTMADKTKEVTATARIKDADGTRNVAAVMNKDDGSTRIVETRPLTEWMHSQELAIGYGFDNGDLAKGLKYDLTFLRVGPLYGSFSASMLDKPASTDWQAMVWLTWRL